ncbi:MAG: ATP-binding cassette domain-containing protein [Acidimicrobiales bacterium]|nr:ATP-binding cassette domain-containing protein [Acidimicrobiales bacterium]
MIRFRDLSLHYEGADHPAVAGVDATIAEGELCVVVGPTGSGKTTLLRTTNGLVPHFSGGTLTGEVTVAGHSIADHHPRDLAEIVGFVVQDPRAGFVTGTVEEELAFSMESLGIDPATMRRRVEEILDLLGLDQLRDRPVDTLSGGEAQRTAIGAALTALPRILVLDEPTSALDPRAAEDVLAALHRLVHDLGITVLMAEHRLERVMGFADRILHLDGPGARIGGPGEMLADSPLAPPLVQLGRVAGWDPPPVHIRDARRLAGGLRERLTVEAEGGSGGSSGTVLLDASGVTVTHDGTVAVHDVSLQLRAGERVALMGRNGAGKTSLLWALQGTGRRDGGRVRAGDADPAELRASDRRRRVGLVPQEPDDLLYLATVDEECAQADRDAGAEPGSTRSLLDSLLPGVPAAAHPRDLSEGQRLLLVLAFTLAAAPPVVLLDEPTRGLDQVVKDRLCTELTRLAAEGHAVVVSTHDVEFAARFATRVAVLAAGDVVTDGPATEVLAGSPMFAPQVAKVLAPLPLLTVDDVKACLP